MFTEHLKSRAYLFTEYLKNSECQLVLVLADAFEAKVKGVVSKIFLRAQSPGSLFVLHGFIF